LKANKSLSLDLEVLKMLQTQAVKYGLNDSEMAERLIRHGVIRLTEIEAKTPPENLR